MKRRQLLVAASLLPFTKIALASDFASFMKEQEEGAKALGTEFEVYQAAYLKEFAAYKKDIEKEWDEAIVLKSMKEWGDGLKAPWIGISSVNEVLKHQDSYDTRLWIQ